MRIGFDEDMILKSGDIEADEALYELRNAGHVVAVQPRVFDLLCCLMRHAPRVVTRAELLTEVWQGTHVCPAAVARAVSVLRRALGDDESAQRLVRTVRSRGYRFIGEVTVVVAHAPSSNRGGVVVPLRAASS